MKRFPHLHALVLSCCSTDLYRDVARHWKGAGLLYLLTLTVLSQIPILVQTQLGVSRFMRTEASKIVDQIPRITIRQGRAYLSAEMPLLIREPRTGGVLAIIDTTGRITSLDQTEAKVLLTGDRMILRRSPTRTKVVGLARLEHLDFEPDVARKWLALFEAWFVVALAPFALAFAYVFRLILVLVFAAIGMAAAPGIKAPLRYPSLMRLTAVAMTPVVILDTIRTTAGLRIPLWWVMAAVLLLVLVLVAVRANAAESPPGEAAPVPPAAG